MTYDANVWYVSFPDCPYCLHVTIQQSVKSLCLFYDIWGQRSRSEPELAFTAPKTVCGCQPTGADAGLGGLTKARPGQAVWIETSAGSEQSGVLQADRDIKYNRSKVG